MTQKYTPLNLSFLANQYSPQATSIANTARYIMANAGWSKETERDFNAKMKAANAEAKKAYNSTHKQSLLGSIFDMLQTPLYGVANALDEATAAHQSDSNDSVITDIGKTLYGFAKGGPKGLAAGARGSTGIIDTLPGIDISDEWQSDPANKTHMSDVAIRTLTGLSTADAANPANWAKVKDALEKANGKSFWNQSLPELLAPSNLEAPDAQQKFLRNEMLGTLPVDIVADPTTWIPGGGFLKGARASKGLTEGLDAARAAGSSTEGVNPIIAGLKMKNASKFEPKVGLNEVSPIGAIQEGAKLSTKNETIKVGSSEFSRPVFDDYVRLRRAGMNDAEISAAHEFDRFGGHNLSNAEMEDLLKIPVTAETAKAAVQLPSISPEAEKGFKTLANLGRRSTPVKGLEVPVRDQTKLTKGIVTLADQGEKGWFYKAAQLLGQHPNVEWTETEKFLRNAVNAVDKKGLRHNPAKMAPALAQKIKQDVEAARTSGDVERRLMNTASLGDIVIRPNAPKLKVAEARLANRVVRKFEGEILGKKGAPGTGPNLARAIAEGRNVRYSGPQQARMWNQITSSLKFADARKFDKAVRILRATEDYFISKGIIPHSAAKTSESVPLRLSQVAEAIGPQFLGKSHAFITGILRGDAKSLAHLNPDQIEALNALRASEATATAPAVQKAIGVGKQAVDDISKMSLSVGRKKALFDEAQKTAKLVAAGEGGGDVGAHVAGKYIGNLIGSSDPINAALNANKLKTEAWLGKVGKSAGKIANDADFTKAVTNAISKAAELPSPASLSGVSGAAARVIDWLGARFNAAYGVQDMHPIYLQQQASAMSTTARRARLINELGRRFNPSDADLWHEAFRTAQQNGVASGRVAELQSEIAKVMENLFGGSGLRSGAIADSTVIGRNRLLLDELNANLKRFGLGQYAFKAAKVKDAAGIEHDFSKGLNWMRSWEAWNVTKPYEFLHKVQNAIEHTVREKNMFDEIASRFGSATKHGDVKYGINHPRLAGYYFTQEGAKQGQIFVRALEELSTPNAKSLQYFDHVLSKIKASLTIYIPGHHWTNLIGDMYYNWIAGVNKPIRYEQAMKTMLAQKGRYGDFASFENLAGPEALQKAILRSSLDARQMANVGLKMSPQGNKVIVTMQNGTKVTADMLYTAAFSQGILPSARVLEDVTSDVSSVLDKFRPLGGRGQRAVHEVSEVRDHIPRLAQFIDGIAKSRGSFAAAVETSAKSVRKWHPDGLDLTKFEKSFMKRVFPFYSWTRKAIPLAIESTLFNSSKVMAYPRLMEAIGLINGVDPTQQITDPFPADQMFPDWMRNRGIGPIVGGAGAYSIVNPSTPVQDTLALLGTPGQSSIDMLNPMGKVPIEAMQGQTLGRGAPIQTNQQWLDYLTKQVPVASQIGRASGQFGVSDNTRAEGFPNWTNILNLLTGAKKVDTGKYQKSAQFDLRDYLKQKGQQQGR